MMTIRTALLVAGAGAVGLWWWRRRHAATTTGTPIAGLGTTATADAGRTTRDHRSPTA
jgi:hypothetical protein